MISVHQLADIISRSRVRPVDLKQISRTPGRERYRGHCPFHADKTPSFDVFVGSDGQGHYFCQARCCKEASGTGRWWLFSVEGKRDDEIPKPDPEVVRLNEANERVRRERDRLEQLFHNRYPDTPDEAFGYLETVQTRLKAARLGG